MIPARAQPACAVEAAPDPDVVCIRDLIYEVAGIFHPDKKLPLLLDRCRRRMKELNTGTLRDYLDCLTSKPNGQGEIVALLNETTVGETCFFRNRAQLEAFRGVVLPKILEAKREHPERTLRIWSAGCSTGEEPYTLRMVLEEADGIGKEWTIKVLATDINERSLAHAKAGVFGTYSTRNLPLHYRQRYFSAAGDQVQVLASLRKNIDFRKVNLSDQARMNFMTGLDVIFCCNVLIYFDLVSKQRVIRNFYNSLLPHGYLFLGHSESLYNVSDDFRLIHLPGATAYVKAPQPSGGK